MFKSFFLNKKDDLDSDEYLSTINSQLEFTDTFNKYLIGLKMENKIIDNKLAGQMYVYKMLQLELDKENLQKIKERMKLLENYIKTYELSLEEEDNDGR